ncbi:MAG: HPr kinase/phosphatase C-terminal domain-containing protein [Pseudomonadota bacterium]
MPLGADDATGAHASCVAFRVAGGQGREGWAGILLRGPSGVGKSALALRLMALGARLVADDQTLLRRAPGPKEAPELIASAAPRLRGVIEARGLGLLQVTALEAAPVRWVVEMRARADRGGERLPPLHHVQILGVRLPLLHLDAGELAASALCCLAQGGALLDPEAGVAEVDATLRCRERHEGGDQRSDP